MMKRIGSTNWSPFKSISAGWCLAFVAVQLGLGAQRVTAQPPRLQIDREKVAAAGLRWIESKHLVLITDVRDRHDVEELGEVMTQAIPQWCEYFGVDPKEAADWKTVGCVMLDRTKFQKAGLLPNDLPPFPAGFQRRGDMWLFVQPGDYYTRHLFLHEGTHAFMENFLGGYGPPWFAEGMAELLAVHRWDNDKLKLKTRITDTSQVPYWGRVKILQDDWKADQTLSLDEVFATPNESFQKVRFYGWAWAACEFFDTHPDLQARFRKFIEQVTSPHDEFNEQFKQQFAGDWDDIDTQWDLFVGEAEYGYDVAAAKPVPATMQNAGAGTSVTISAERGWQSTGLNVSANQNASFEAAGEFQIKQDEQPWVSQPGGVTIEYYRGRPLGQLIASIRTENGFTEPITIGRSKDVRFAEAGELYLRVNESPASWDDNQGSLQVRINLKSD